MGWCEGELSDLQPSFFNPFRPYDPMWPVKPLFGVGGDLDIASPQEVAEARRLVEPHVATCWIEPLPVVL
ncbi:hypothetical protein GA0070609_6472 [Micromonospora echinaurantiaca]|uniref:Uncharacterized protein n=1 Tax=Micromonospora echinaurantiaca TaxID=47857 RepID=A0A1C5KCL2_9ACTN|nr:hypothetical protein [Micromonospora echinaurantiaca]SCG80488.1 hypothetical protein GA0070609_6472 [Micromonospora echinaurantiaca]